jgi:glycosyltransferase involved in cell wall biosynthesis
VELLVIAHLFPPLGGGGVQRTLAFVRHLVDHGWRSTVITAGDDSDYWARDETLVARIPPSAEIHRIREGVLGAGSRTLRRAIPRSLRPSIDRAVFFPDRAAPWIPNASRRAVELCRSRRFDAIFSTSGPWSDHAIALSIAGTFGLPWIADFRDPWTHNHVFVPASPLHRAAHAALERRVYRRARRVIVTTKGHAGLLERDFAEARGKVSYIPNGFEADEIAGLPVPPPRARKRIAYAGSLYPGQGADAFFAILAAALAKEPGLRGSVVFDLHGKAEGTGPIPPVLEDMVVRHGYVPHAEALRRQAEADATLLLMSDAPQVPGKLYELLALGRPLLAITPEGETAALIREAKGSALIVAPQDGPERLIAWLLDLGRGALPSGFDRGVVDRFDRARHAAELAALLDQARAASSTAAI